MLHQAPRYLGLPVNSCRVQAALLPPVLR